MVVGGGGWKERVLVICAIKGGQVGFHQKDIAASSELESINSLTCHNSGTAAMLTSTCLRYLICQINNKHVTDAKIANNKRKEKKQRNKTKAEKCCQTLPFQS